MPEQYKLDLDRYPEVRNQVLLRTVPTVLLALLGGLAIIFFREPDMVSGGDFWPFLIPGVALLVVVSILSSLKRFKAIFGSYRLTISADMLTREQVNTPTVSIRFADVEEVARTGNGGFMVRGKDRTDLIIIPAQIEHIDLVERALARIMAISDKPRESLVQKYQLPLAVLSVVMMVAVYSSDNRFIVGVSALVVLGMMGWSLREIRKSKNVDMRTKRSMWIGLIVMASVAVVAVTKLIGKF